MGLFCRQKYHCNSIISTVLFINTFLSFTVADVVLSQFKRPAWHAGCFVSFIFWTMKFFQISLDLYTKKLNKITRYCCILYITPEIHYNRVEVFRKPDFRKIRNYLLWHNFVECIASKNCLNITKGMFWFHVSINCMSSFFTGIEPKINKCPFVVFFSLP